MSVKRALQVTLALGVVPAAFAAFSVGCQAAEGGFAERPHYLVDEGEGSGGKPSCVVKYENPADKPSGAESKWGYGAGPGTRRTVYMNKGGGTYYPGSNNSSTNRSSIASFTATIPAYAKGDERWKKLVACVKDKYARFNIVVTDADPGDAPHIEAVVGGRPGNLGLGSGVGGIAPMTGSCSDAVVERAVVYVFSDVFSSDQEECAVVAHESGHSLGLDHEYLCEDPMTYLQGCGVKQFQDKAASCGTYSGTSCGCGAKQNSVQHLLKWVGPAGTPPPPPPVPDGGAPPPPPPSDGGAPPPPPADGGAPVPPEDGGAPPPPPPGGDVTGPSITALTPADGATLPGDTTLTIRATISDPSGVSKALVRWTIGGKTTELDCASPPFEVTCSVSGSTYTWRIPVGTGTRGWSITATDGKGNIASSTARALNLGGSPPPPPPPVDDGGVAPPPPADDGGVAPPPPPPSGAPVISFTAPSVGSKYTAGGKIPVTVTVTDDGKVASVKLFWRSASGDTSYALENIGPNTWGVDLDLSPTASAGNRTLRIVATDDVGNAATTPDRVITIGP